MMCSSAAALMAFSKISIYIWHSQPMCSIWVPGGNLFLWMFLSPYSHRIFNSLKFLWDQPMNIIGVLGTSSFFFSLSLSLSLALSLSPSLPLSLSLSLLLSQFIETLLRIVFSLKQHFRSNIGLSELYIDSFCLPAHIFCVHQLHRHLQCLPIPWISSQ